ncbi:alcohol dehydrogenase transcription factor myb/SANT-like domain-containing protein [Ditylenchus destructor]|uniref:Alcohol dehydrogenase transcription factor myb/SANT-like domain-containing protein n=1 Tax=Ditylenchus destructor TaxID=166010 RepID=A0AAD4ND61_9BILA|nr:alcohol dehydrogenase transcription factor myb/SANT-like domain-containing protein [Ditylenchus destructor]
MINDSNGRLFSENTSKLEVVNNSPAPGTRLATVGGGGPASSSGGGFHLPELKTNNIVADLYANKDEVGLQQPLKLSQNGAVTPAHSTKSSSSGAQPVNTAAQSLLNSDEFIERLIEAVKKQPCLYNPTHEHYGNKHASAQYRAVIWQQLCHELDYPDEPQSLQTQWKRVRDRYVRERRKRRNAGQDLSAPKTQNGQNPNSMSAAQRHFERMRWIDEYLVTNESNANSASLSNALNNGSNEDVGYFYDQHANQRAGPGGLSGSADAAISSQFNNNNAVMRTPVNKGKNESTNGSPSSTSSEISVGSAQNSAQHPLLYRGKDGNLHAPPGYQLVTVPAQPTADPATMSASEKIDQSIMTMLIGDGTQPSTAATTFYQHQPAGPGTSQRMYRVVNLPTTSAAIGQEHSILGHTQNTAESQLVHQPATKRKRLSVSQASRAAMQQNLAQDGGGILIDGNTLLSAHPQTLVIEQGDQRILINNSTASQQPHETTLLGQGTSGMQQHSYQQVHSAGGSLQHGGSISTHAGRVIGVPTRTIPATGNGRGAASNQQYAARQQSYVLSTNTPSNAIQPQPQYDPEAALIETIVTHLARLNDDEKVVTKMNIQRILMDARFGRGACVRMFREEEQSENLAAMERHMQQQQQQQNNAASSRR